MYMFDAPKGGHMDVQEWRIQMWTKEGEPWATLTINNPDADPKKGIFLVKDYSENMGVFAWLRDKGFVRETLNVSPCGDGNMILCKLDVNKIKKWGREEEKEISR